MRQIAEATWVCGDPGMQFDTTVNDWHTCPNTARINASNPCSEYMFLDDSACNLASINLMKFVARGRRVRRRGVRQGVRDVHHGAGNPRRQRELSDAGDRAQQPRLPAARPRLREPRRAADVARPAVRQRRRPRLRGGDHGGDARRGLRAVGARRARSRRAVPRLREEPRADAARHAQAPRGAQGHRPHARPEGSVRVREEDLGRVRRARRAARLPQRAGDRARADRHHRLHDGLRHDRRRAGHRARQVQEARRRRADEDRQQHRPDGARRSSATRRRRSRTSSATSTRTRRSKARRTSRTRTSRCSTARSSRRAACARSTTWATSR